MSAWPPIYEIAAKVKSGELKAADLVEQALKTIEDQTEFQAIIATTADRARERAKAIDADPQGRLAGVPFIAKDNFLVFGAETTAASNILKGFTAPYQSTAVERLEAEGAICVAKANLDAFAHGSSTENSDFFPTKNPHDPAYVPGGSSGGSAASVMLDMVPFALGSDTGGSIRLPAAFCGAVGYKPTYGLVSRSGVVAMASSLDVIGPITRTVDDAALVLDILAGKDPLDSTTIERETTYAEPSLNLKGKKVGIIKEHMTDDVQSEVKDAVNAAIDKLKEVGAEVVEVSLPSLVLGLAVYYVLCPAEVSSNLSRYDGQRYGFTYNNAKDIDESYFQSREIGFGKEAKRRIMLGTYVLSSGYYDAYYKKAQTVRTKLIDEFDEVFKQVDFLIGPTAAAPAFKLGEVTDPLEMYLADIMTVGADLVGNPAISIPCGVSGKLPIGLQLMAPSRADAALLGFAKQTEALLA
jgi:aspartyl-tRNA(Asn)/glutamyl-tRNA(Gln) amidotransferase subunit A